MSRIIRTVKPLLPLAGALALATAAGFGAATALGTSAADPPRTVTVNVATGPAGPAGPAGPPGESGLACIDGYSPGVVVFIQQGQGPTRLYGCLGD